MIRRLARLLALFLIGFMPLAGFAQSNGNTPPSYKLEGEAVLTSNLVTYGITQTNKDPALVGAFWFNWGPQFRMGVLGNNVAYEGSDTHFQLRVCADIKIAISSNAELTLRYAQHQYFKSNTFNGTVSALHLNMFTYELIYEQISNFFGTELESKYYAARKTWDVMGNWKWSNQGGYMLLEEFDNYNSFFDFRSMLGTKPGSIFYEFGGTYNTGASQYNGASGLFVILQATIKF